MYDEVREHVLAVMRNCPSDEACSYAQKLLEMLTTGAAAKALGVQITYVLTNVQDWKAKLARETKIELKAFQRRLTYDNISNIKGCSGSGQDTDLQVV